MSVCGQMVTLICQGVPEYETNVVYTTDGIKIVSSSSSLNLFSQILYLLFVFCSLCFVWKGFCLYSFWCVDSSNLPSFTFLCFTYPSISCLHGRHVVRLSCSEFPELDFVTILLASLQFTLDSNQLLGILKSLYSEYFVNIIYLPLWVFHSFIQSDNGINPGKETSWKKSFKYPWQPCSARQFVYIDFIRTQTKN